MNFSNVDFEKLDRDISLYCAENQIFGMIRITLKDNVIFEKNIGYANIKKQIPFTQSSMFSFYSLSKPFCIIGLSKLRDRGLVDIDRHPSVYVPEAKGFYEGVTIRHMLHHVSGLPDFHMSEGFADKHPNGYPKNIRKQLSELVAYPQFFEPETHTKYANINMILCALIIENVSGMSYAEYMKKEVFEPLGMKTAVIDNESLYIEDRVQGYEISDGAVTEIERANDWMLGAGDVVGTLDDVYALNKAIKHELLLKHDTWQEILTPHWRNTFGMGCTVKEWHDKKTIFHNGGHLGFRTYHVQIPEDDLDLIILSNSGYGMAREDIGEIVYSAFYDTNTKPSLTTSSELDKGYI